MEHYALRKYRGPEIWARVRTAYLAGESAPSVARRFDVGLGNLRKRASAEGWTRSRAALRQDLKPERSAPASAGEADGLCPNVGAPPGETAEYPVGTREAVKRAAERAAWLITEGRAAEAMALIRAAEALSSLVDRQDLDQETPVQRFLRQGASTVAPAKAQPL
ncbi:MAG: hypothetical protein Q7J13_09930 [Brevundimonas sp.]|uniref:hypothetical protein n=1 Tax=Brevundimonas sp. TaxID=1871086 RepID=UPI0027197092|nr:hypothetical protein [Brevundimonas sp.]MDO9588241.1 hypothetical protein [Brevundimonas sp.]